MKRILLQLLSLALLFLVAPLARAGGGGLPPGTTPVAGPVEIFVTSSTTETTPGGFVVADIAIVNSSTEVTVRGALRASIRFSDGSRQQLRLPALVLEPDSAMIFQLFVPLPTDAPLGEATIGATVFVGGRGDGTWMTHVARDADTFDVVAP